MKKGTQVWDVVVVGGGPAGMMAALTAARRGKSVLLLEKNNTLGKKLLITGGGRCNVTNNKPTIRDMLAKYKKSDKFLFSAFSQFAVTNTLDYFQSKGMPTKEENEGRVFPQSNTARSVWDVLVQDMQKSGVEVLSQVQVTNISKPSTPTASTLATQEPFSFLQKAKTDLFEVALSGGGVVLARSCVLATGGTSHPETGSTGDGFLWMRKLGHKVVENDFALVPIALSNVWVKKLAGLTLTDIKLTVFSDGQKKLTEKGKVLFTHFGVSGPTILNMSREIGEWAQYGKVEIILDLFPTQDHGTLKATLQKLLVIQSNKKIKNVLSDMLPKALVPVVLQLTNIDGDTFCHSVRSEERVALVALCKALPLFVKGLLGADKAVVSSGGVVPEEVDFKTMQSRLVPGLFVVGDMLNIDRPSGGYSLQLCWTTGFVAGSHC